MMKMGSRGLRLSVLLVACFMPFNISRPLRADEKGDGGYEASPLPAGMDSLTWKRFREAEAIWTERNILETYAECGAHSPQWDEQAKVYFGKYVQGTMTYFRDRDLLVEIHKLGEQILSLGCTDPHIAYLQGNVAFQLNGCEAAEPLVRKGLELLEKSRYPRTYLYYAARRMEWIARAKKMSPEVVGAFVRKKMTYLGQAAADHAYVDGNQRHYFENVLSEWERYDVMPQEGETLLNEVERSSDAEPWCRAMVNGRCHLTKAWLARGFGPASEIPSESRRTFMRELEAASEAFRDAHEVHPEFPEAATAMIAVVASSGEPSPRLWFDRAVAAQFDYIPAYHELFWALRPRWCGSHKQMYEFGKECLDTKRFDTEVPRMYLKALWDVGSELDDWRKPYKRTGVYKQLQTFFDGMLNEPSRVEERNYWKSVRAILAWTVGKYTESKKFFDELGDDALEAAFQEYRLERRFVLAEVRLRGGDSRDVFNKANTLFENGQSVDALPLFTALDAAGHDDPEVHAFLLDRIAVLQWKKSFRDGDWVRLAPTRQYSGWNNKGGQWDVESDNVIKEMSGLKDTWHMFLCNFKVDEDYEIRGEVETRCNAGIVLGWVDGGFPLLATFMIDVADKKICLNEKVYITKAESSAELPEKNRFLLRVADGRISASVNDKPVFTNEHLDPSAWAPLNGMVGVGCAYNKGPGNQTVFRDLQIRRLPGKNKNSDGGKAN
jgi:hypothetical protein